MYDSLSIVVPVYQAAAMLPEMCARIANAMTACGARWELILVDDGSSDASWQVMIALAEQRPEIRCLRLHRNFGQHPATLAGLREAGHAVAVTLDDDGQHPPEAIPELVAALKKTGARVAYGEPVVAFRPRLYTVLAAVVKYALAAACAAPFIRDMRSFRAIDLRGLELREMRIYRGSTIEGFLASVRPRVCTVPVRYGERLAGTSTYSWQRSARLAFNVWRSRWCVRCLGPEVTIEEASPAPVPPVQDQFR